MDASLLQQLQRPSPSLTYPILEGLIAQHLSHASIPQPTPLAAAIISSPLWHPLNAPRLHHLSTSLRRATQQRLKVLETEEGSGLFVPSRRSRLQSWTKAVVQGFRGGDPLLRLAATGGLLQGLEDLKGKFPGLAERSAVEDEVALSLAEVTDDSQWSAPWTAEFGSQAVTPEEDRRSLSLVQAAYFMPLVDTAKWQALDLFSIASFCLHAVEDTFNHGDFLAQFCSLQGRNSEGRVQVSSTAPVALEIEELSKSTLFLSIASLAKLSARMILVMGEAPSHTVRLRAWQFMVQLTHSLSQMTAKVEDQWLRGPLAAVSSDAEIEPASTAVTTKIWNVLKTLLFTVVLLSQSVFSVLRFHRPPSALNEPKLLPSSLAISVLHTLAHLSFVISHFGGVSFQGGFDELKSVFYAALDVLSQDHAKVGEFLHQLHSWNMQALADAPPIFSRAKHSYTLACVEQLIPLLSEEEIEKDVLPLCLPHLSNPEHREIYESAHATILAVFVSSSRRNAEGTRHAVVTERLVPFYAQCLLENSIDDRLNDDQLRMAYSALVRTACKVGLAVAPTPLDQTDYSALGLWTIQLLSAILNPDERHAAAKLTPTQVRRLRFTLVSLISCVPSPLLPCILSEVREIITTERAGSERRALVDAVFREVIHEVGDAGKQIALQWYEDLSRVLEQKFGEEDSDLKRVVFAAEDVGLNSQSARP